ncbi:MAG: hypothetical protein HC896_05405 [Bacteroidales bacterium]|nr:hypothetical protein [Bacteroidales bacterium]
MLYYTVMKTALRLEMIDSNFNIDYIEFIRTGEVPFTITSSSGNYGIISPAGDSTVEQGSSITYTFIPDSGYQVKQVLVNNIAVDSLKSYTFENIASDHTIM